MTRTSAKLLIVLLTALPHFAAAGDLTADEIMRKVQIEREDGKTAKRQSTMVLIDSRGNKRVRKLTQFTKDYGDPENQDIKMVSQIIEPAEIKGTGYLSYDWGDSSKDDDAWLYLPVLKKVKRLANTDKSGAFMGSDFTYTDLRTNTLEYWNYSILKDSDVVDGVDCYVIEGTPKPEIKDKVIKETGYSKLKLWIRKDYWMTLRGEFAVKKGNRTKTMVLADFEEIQGIMTAKTSQMTLYKGDKQEHATVLITDSVVYDEPIDDEFFTPQTLEKGL